MHDAGLVGLAHGPAACMNHQFTVASPSVRWWSPAARALSIGSNQVWCLCDIGSLPRIKPNSVHMCKHHLVQVIAWHLFCAKLLQEPMLTDYQLNPRNKHGWAFKCNSFFIENVLKIADKNSVKVQFRGLELFKEKGTLFEEESYLAKIFRPFSLHLHTFHHVYNAFWCWFFFRKHGKSITNDWQDRHVLIVMSWSWRHNSGARELSTNHTLQSMTTTCWGRRWQADGLLSCCYNGDHIVKLCRHKRRNYVRIGAISSQSYQQLVNEGLKILGG